MTPFVIDLQIKGLKLVTTETSDLSTLAPGIGDWNTIKDLYNNPRTEFKMMGTLLNYILTNDYPCFMMSRRILENVIKEDNNITQKSNNGTQYKMVIKHLIDMGIIKCICKYKKLPNRAALFRLVNKDLRALIEDIDNKEQAYLKEYCQYNNITLDERFIPVILERGFPPNI